MPAVPAAATTMRREEAPPYATQDEEGRQWSEAEEGEGVVAVTQRGAEALMTQETPLTDTVLLTQHDDGPHCTGQKQQEQEQQPGEAGGGRGGRKRLRPPSWQRRKAAKARLDGQQAQQAGQGEGGRDGQEGEVGASLPSTQPVEEQRRSPQQAGRNGQQQQAPPAPPAPPSRAAPPWREGGGPPPHTLHARLHGWPIHTPRPTDMVLQRSSVLHCSFFGAKPGLPRSRELFRRFLLARCSSASAELFVFALLEGLCEGCMRTLCARALLHLFLIQH
jgi:hypothetical protein